MDSRAVLVEDPAYILAKHICADFKGYDPSRVPIRVGIVSMGDDIPAGLKHEGINPFAVKSIDHVLETGMDLGAHYRGQPIPVRTLAQSADALLQFSTSTVLERFAYNALCHMALSDVGLLRPALIVYDPRLQMRMHRRGTSVGGTPTPLPFLDLPEDSSRAIVKLYVNQQVVARSPRQVSEERRALLH